MSHANSQYSDAKADQAMIENEAICLYEVKIGFVSAAINSTKFSTLDSYCKGVLQCVAVRCSVLQCVAVCCSALQCVAVCVVAALRGVLQRVAVCCSVCCSVC